MGVKDEKISMRYLGLLSCLGLCLLAGANETLAQPGVEPAPIASPRNEPPAVLFQQLIDLPPEPRKRRASLSSPVASEGKYAVFSARVVSLGEKAVSFLEKQTRRTDWKARWLARALLGRIQHPATYVEYKAALEKHFWQLTRPGAIVVMPDTRRIDALNAPLEGLDSLEVLPFLVESVVWNQEPRPEIATLALGLLGDRSAIPPLEYSACSGDEPLAAIKALLRLKDKNVPRIVVQRLREEEHIPGQTVWLGILGRARDTSVIPDLQEWIKTTDDPLLQQTTEEVIRYIQGLPPKSGFFSMSNLGVSTW